MKVDEISLRRLKCLMYPKQELDSVPKSAVLPIGYYFNAGLVLGDQGTLNCVVRIIRQAARWRRAYLRLRDCRNSIDYGLFV